MKLSVHIITRGRLELLKTCLSSVLHALPRDAEVIVVVNGEDLKTIAWLESMSHPALIWSVVSKETISRCRNRAFHQCRGEIIYFLDDDVVVPKHLLIHAIKRFETLPLLAVLGGPNLTPPNSAWFERCSGAVMTSFFAAPMIRMRYGASRKKEFEATEHHLIFCNLAVRQNMCQESIRFPERFRANEENLFLYHAKKAGLMTHFCADLFVYHRRRKTVLDFAKQVAHYGFGRAEQTIEAWQSCHPLFLVPASVWVLPAVLFLLPSARAAFLPLLCSYIMCCVSAALLSQQARQQGVWGCLGVIFLTPVVHLGYGYGFWKGLFFSLWTHLKFLRVQPPVIETNKRMKTA